MKLLRTRRLLGVSTRFWKRTPDIIFMSEVKNFALLSRLRDYGGLVPMSHANTLVCMRTRQHDDRSKINMHSQCGLSLFASWMPCTDNPSPGRGVSLNSVRKQHRLLSVYKSIGIHVVPSNYSKQRLIQHGFQSDQVTVVGHFTNMRPMPAVPRDGQPPIVSFTGHMHRYKGADYLLRALKRVSGPFRCSIIGDGFTCLTANNWLVNSDWPMWWTSGDGYQRKISRHIWLLLPCRLCLPFGLRRLIVGLEAMMCSKPVVAFDVGGISDWLKDGRTGYLVPVKDTALLGQKIEALLTDLQTAATMGAEGRRLVMSTFTKGQHFERLLTVFEKAAALRPCKRQAFTIVK